MKLKDSIFLIKAYSIIATIFKTISCKSFSSVLCYKLHLINIKHLKAKTVIIESY